MRCTCEASESPHHHAFGGVYPCDGVTSCRRCRDADERLWRDELGDTPAESGRRYIQRKYGKQTARVLYGRDPNMED